MTVPLFALLAACPGMSAPVDLDGDGYTDDVDCDDTNPEVHPGREEVVCDGFDNDCDGSRPASEMDRDGDGQAPCEGDCGDVEPTQFAGAEELCDGRDTDCDGVVPPEERDSDSDGVRGCDGDCDDVDASVFPGASELCDGEDNDCDGRLPEDEWDADSDGVSVCEGDCDDESFGTRPGRPEICDGVDNDCDGVLGADETDRDGDGWLICNGDCGEGDGSVYPGAVELCDGVDSNCDGVSDEGDSDGDGARACEDCDESDPSSYPGAPEFCDGRDTDCDGIAEPDADGDGFWSCAECDDSQATVYPGAPELCDGLDNDCDPATPADGDGDADGWSVCEGDCDDGEASVHPSAVDECDAAGVDQDCDGVDALRYDSGWQLACALPLGALDHQEVIEAEGRFYRVTRSGFGLEQMQLQVDSSTDLTSWDREADSTGQPSWAERRAGVSAPSPIHDPDDVLAPWKLFGHAISEHLTEGHRREIFLQSAPYPSGPWTFEPTPVVETVPGGFDAWTAHAPTVEHDPVDGGLLMLYSARETEGGPLSLVRARSFDGGYSWERDPGPLVVDPPPPSWRMSHPELLWIDDGWSVFWAENDDSGFGWISHARLEGDFLVRSPEVPALQPAPPPGLTGPPLGRGFSHLSIVMDPVDPDLYQLFFSTGRERAQRRRGRGSNLRPRLDLLSSTVSPGGAALELLVSDHFPETTQVSVVSSLDGQVAMGSPDEDGLLLLEPSLSAGDHLLVIEVVDAGGLSRRVETVLSL